MGVNCHDVMLLDILVFTATGLKCNIDIVAHYDYRIVTSVVGLTKGAIAVVDSLV